MSHSLQPTMLVIALLAIAATVGFLVVWVRDRIAAREFSQDQPPSTGPTRAGDEHANPDPYARFTPGHAHGLVDPDQAADLAGRAPAAPDVPTEEDAWMPGPVIPPTDPGTTGLPLSYREHALVHNALAVAAQIAPPRVPRALRITPLAEVFQRPGAASTVQQAEPPIAELDLLPAADRTGPPAADEPPPPILASLFKDGIREPLWPGLGLTGLFAVIRRDENGNVIDPSHPVGQDDRHRAEPDEEEQPDAGDIPGVQIRMAANHWRLAVETHNTNHPDADHPTPEDPGPVAPVSAVPLSRAERRHPGRANADRKGGPSFATRLVTTKGRS
jgi:hypothetical protein